MSTIAAASKLLLESRINKLPVLSIPPSIASANLLDGYAVQNEMIARSVSEDCAIGKLTGWKVGATNNAAQKALGFGPFYGPLFASSFMDQSSCVKPSSVSLSRLGANFRAAEAEFAFEMDQDLPPLAGGVEYSEGDVWALVRSVIPSIEMAAGRIADGVPYTPATTVADFALNGCNILSSQRIVVSRGDTESWKRLSSVQCELEVNGVKVTAATGESVLGNPVTALTWLANALIKSGDGHMLRAGDIVLTGAACLHKTIASGDSVTAKFIGVPSADGDVTVPILMES